MLAAIFSRVRAHTTRSNTELRAPFPSLPAQNSDWLEGCSLLAVYGSEQVPDSLSLSLSRSLVLSLSRSLPLSPERLYTPQTLVVAVV